MFLPPDVANRLRFISRCFACCPQFVETVVIDILALNNPHYTGPDASNLLNEGVLDNWFGLKVGLT